MLYTSIACVNVLLFIADKEVFSHLTSLVYFGSALFPIVVGQIILYYDHNCNKSS